MLLAFFVSEFCQGFPEVATVIHCSEVHDMAQGVCLTLPAQFREDCAVIGHCPGTDHTVVHKTGKHLTVVH